MSERGDPPSALVSSLEALGGSPSARALALITAERARALIAGHSATDDAAEHTDGELADAAICYLTYAGRHHHHGVTSVPFRWPWDAEDFAPGTTGVPDADQLRDLVRAGQLVVAEIARLLVSSASLPMEGVDG